MPRTPQKLSRNSGELCFPVVMLGDANLLNRKLLRDILSLKGYHVREISNGKRVFDALIHQKPDLAVVNVNILDVSGAETLSRMRAEKVLEGIPLIIVGNWAQEKPLVMGDAYFKQPISATQLCATVDTLLGQHRKYTVS